MLSVDACLIVTPYYNKPTQEGLYLHYRAVAEAVSIPQILYNVPGRTACDLLPETVGRLAAVPNIIGIKEATGDLKRIKAIQASCSGEFVCYSGDDITCTDFMLNGGRGVISVTANVVPQLMHDMCAASLAGDQKGAHALQTQLLPLHQQLFVESNPIPVKWALCMMNKIPTGIRLPLTVLSSNHHDALKTAMQTAGVKFA